MHLISLIMAREEFKKNKNVQQIKNDSIKFLKAHILLTSVYE